MTMSTLAIGLRGMQSALDRIERSAARVAHFGQAEAEADPAAGQDLATGLVRQRQDTHLYTANLRVVQAADRMLGSLLDRSA